MHVVRRVSDLDKVRARRRAALVLDECCEDGAARCQQQSLTLTLALELDSPRHTQHAAIDAEPDEFAHVAADEHNVAVPAEVWVEDERAREGAGGNVCGERGRGGARARTRHATPVGGHGGHSGRRGRHVGRRRASTSSSIVYRRVEVVTIEEGAHSADQAVTVTSGPVGPTAADTVDVPAAATCVVQHKAARTVGPCRADRDGSAHRPRLLGCLCLFDLTVGCLGRVRRQLAFDRDEHDVYLGRLVAMWVCRCGCRCRCVQSSVRDWLLGTCHKGEEGALSGLESDVRRRAERQVGRM